MDNKNYCGTIGIVGLGLIGASLARAITEKTDYKVLGYDIDDETQKQAKLIGAIHGGLTDENYSQVDILIVALTPKKAAAVMETTAKKLKDGALIMDIAGTKKLLVQKMSELSKAYPKLNFISSHPMAGKEFSGIKHSSPTLFDKASMLLVPVKSDLALTANIKALCKNIGFDMVVITNAEKHDEMIAYTSQLAHIISSCYMDNPLCAQHNGYSAGSFKDLTRVAKMNAAMWAELFCENSDNLLKMLDIFINNLINIKTCLQNGDENQLNNLLSNASQKKDTVESLSSKA